MNYEFDEFLQPFPDELTPNVASVHSSHISRALGSASGRELMIDFHNGWIYAAEIDEGFSDAVLRALRRITGGCHPVIGSTSQNSLQD